MVSNALFYTVLGIAIFLLFALVFFMVFIQRKMKNPLLGHVMTTLHSTLFGYETALMELIGTRGYRTHVFPQVISTIKSLESNSPYLKNLYQSETLEEAMQNWMTLLHKAGVVKKGAVTHLQDHTYQIDIPFCAMHDPIHEEIGDQKGICPMALILTAAGTINSQNFEPEIEYSTFHPAGTTTLVKFKQVD